MKHNYYSSAMNAGKSLLRAGILLYCCVALALLASCSLELDNAEKFADNFVDDVVLSAESYEFANLTNSGSSVSLISFAWKNGEAIDVFQIAPSVYHAKQKVKADGVSLDAEFDDSGWPLFRGNTYAAYSPYNKEQAAKASYSAVPVTMTGQKQVGNASLEHIGDSYDYMYANAEIPLKGDVSLSFQHVCAIVMLQLTMPEDASWTSATLTSENDVFVSSCTMNVSDGTLANMVTSKSQTLELANVSGKNITLYMAMLPCTTGDLALTVISSTDKEYTAKLSSKSLVAGKAYKWEASPKPSLSLSETNFNLSSEAHTVTVEVSADCEWSVRSEDESWCSVSSAGNTITINVSSNQITESRSCRILVNYGNQKVEYISLSQQALIPSLSLSKTNFNLSENAQTVTVKVTANCEWSVRSEDESWCSVSSKDNTITINVRSNETNESRSCRILVNYGNQKVEYISLSQQKIPKAPANAKAVDLGLPSGIKWANMNVGATQVGDYGNYYAWGETEPQSSNRYYWDSYKWCKGSSTTMTKYCVSSSYGTVDGKKVLDPEDDAAHVNWGGDWRMPTKAEQDELRNNCTWKWTSNYNGTGVAGRIVTGPNGNSIFLPAAGYRYSSSFGIVGSCGYYWSSSLYSGLDDDAYDLYFDSSDVVWFSNGRCCGHSVRAVCR